MSKDMMRFCPLHGDYAVVEQETACPDCRANPEEATISLQRVRVLGTGSIGTLATGDSFLTPISEELPCPVCGVDLQLSEFRYESLGEEWTREAAEWAEEGVCPSCYRDILPPYIREWSDGEWLSHHFEGWRNTVDSVTEIRRYEDSAQEAWLPASERHKLLDVEATLSARREHLALCQSAMEELCNRYPSSMTPPPFEQMLVLAREKGLSESALEELRDLHSADVAIEVERREDSIVIDGSKALGAGGDPGPQYGEGADAQSRQVAGPRVADHGAPNLMNGWTRFLAAAAIFALLAWLLSRI